MLYFHLLHAIVLSNFTKNRLAYSIMVSIIAFSISFLGLFVASSLEYIIQASFYITNWTINFIITAIIEGGLLYGFFKISKFKNGFSFLKKINTNEYIDMFILSISILVLFIFLRMGDPNGVIVSHLVYEIVFIAIIMVLLIQKTLKLNYKQKLLYDELDRIKLELSEKCTEIEELEKENLSFTKTSHSIAHKQKAIEYKLDQILINNEFANETDITNKVKSIYEEYRNSLPLIKLKKTDITDIDDMLNSMQHECNKSNISLDLQLNGDIYSMISIAVSKEDLEILLADFIKNAIIAINSSENVNRSILVKLGVLNNCYSLYVYDSGIEFSIQTLVNLGLKPSTTHVDSGGTGMGYMNTFDTLKKYNASLIISEKHPPISNDYTKYVAIHFDNKAEYAIKSYRAQKIKSEDITNRVIIKDMQ
jgi:hypothetical protein